MKIFYFDCETTGVDERIHGLHQLSGLIEIDGIVRNEFDIKFRPHNTAIIDPAALEVSGVTIEQLMAYPDESEGYAQLLKIVERYINKWSKTDKMFPCGYNSNFDVRFLRELFTRQGNKYFGSYFWSGSLDVMVLALQKLAPVRHTLVNFKLMTSAKALGIEIDESRLHDARYDIELTRKMHKILTA